MVASVGDCCGRASNVFVLLELRAAKSKSCWWGDRMKFGFEGFRTADAMMVVVSLLSLRRRVEVDWCSREYRQRLTTRPNMYEEFVDVKKKVSMDEMKWSIGTNYAD